MRFYPYEEMVVESSREIDRHRWTSECSLDPVKGGRCPVKGRNGVVAVEGGNCSNRNRQQAAIEAIGSGLFYATRSADSC